MKPPEFEHLLREALDDGEGAVARRLVPDGVNVTEESRRLAVSMAELRGRRGEPSLPPWQAVPPCF